MLEFMLVVIRLSGIMYAPRIDESERNGKTYYVICFCCFFFTGLQRFDITIEIDCERMQWNGVCICKKSHLAEFRVLVSQHRLPIWIGCNIV